MQTNAPAQNPGIVPPWLTGGAAPAPQQNPGIVPPWLQDEFTILPVGEPLAGDTQYVRDDVEVLPRTFVDAVRGH